MASPDTPTALRERLAYVGEVRRFASDALALPDNGSFTTFVELGRPYVAWNVFAAREFSVEPRRWCFLVAGCVNYRGYFEQDRALELRAATSSARATTCTSPRSPRIPRSAISTTRCCPR